MLYSEKDPINGSEMSLATIILAAGKGTRMRSDLAKVLHRVCGEPMVYYSVDLARKVGSSPIVLVVGHQAEVIKEALSGDDLVYVLQREQLGTGHAVLQAKDVLSDFAGDVLILCGDVPLLTRQTVESLVTDHRRSRAVVTVLTTMLDAPSGYGRIVKENDSAVLKIVEDRDATDDEKKIKEINSGIYCVNCRFLFDAVSRIGNDNVQKEYYLTDIVETARQMSFQVNAFLIDDSMEVMGINTIDELHKASRIMEERRSLGCPGQ
ncbi:MAG: NTP transferase domain-containing protein [Deltaproteobacteria bacterium]|nr:NTP transferase domain-containing protein [Deltaproteobacteria bacterium]